MKFKILRICIAITILIQYLYGYAESLPLTTNQIQKLQALFPNSGNEESHLIWNGDPLSVDLPLNQEKRLIFPDHVTVDVKGQLTTDQLRIINNDRSLYFTALKSFATTRIYITLAGSGEVILMDIATNNKATNQTETIDVMQNNNNLSKSSSNSVVTTASWINPSESTSDSSDDGISTNERTIHLIRYAWQQLFAPESFIPMDSNITSVPMHTPFFLTSLIYGDKVLAHPLSEWEDNTSNNNDIGHFTKDNALGYLSDPQGNPFLRGKLITNAPAFLTGTVALGAAEGAASAYAQSQTTNQTSLLGSLTSTVTGSPGKYIAGQAAMNAASTAQQWWSDREEQSFDAIYVAPGQEIVVNFAKEIEIDYDPVGRKLTYVHANTSTNTADLD